MKIHAAEKMKNRCGRVNEKPDFSIIKVGDDFLVFLKPFWVTFVVKRVISAFRRYRNPAKCGCQKRTCGCPNTRYALFRKLEAVS